MEKRFDEIDLINRADLRIKKAERLEELKKHLRFQFRLISTLLFMLAMAMAYWAGSE